MANVDELMAELLLPEDANNHSYSHLKSSFSSTAIINNTTYTDSQIPNSETILSKKAKIEVNSVISTNYSNKTQTLIAPTPIYPQQQNSTVSYSNTQTTMNPINNYQNFTMK